GLNMWAALPPGNCVIRAPLPIARSQGRRERNTTLAGPRSGRIKQPMLPAKPCLPTSAPSPPVGPEWLHEIKHDGYRMLALRDGERVRLLSRRGLDWGDRFPTIVAAVEALAVQTAS